MFRREQVTFDFSLVGASGVLDLMMTLHYRGKTTAAPIVRYTALDQSGQQLPDVEVHSCYGSGFGQMALTPGENTDLLYLRGVDVQLTADVAGEVVDLRPQRQRENPVVEVIQLDDLGRELPSGGGFHQLALINPWPAEALCRVVGVALDAPSSGPQGAIDVVQLTTDPVVVPPRSHVAVPLAADAYSTISRYFGASFVTVKAFPAAR